MMARISVGAAARLVLLVNAGDDEPRVAILPPGPRAVPVAYPTMSAALAALRNKETNQ